MRQFTIATIVMLLGMAFSVVCAWLLASTWQSFSDRWLIPVAFLPAIGVAVGCWLAHQSSKGRDPWPIVRTDDRIRFVLLGAIGSAAASYLVYITISSVWFEVDFIEMALNPSHIKAYFETNKYGQHESGLITNMVIGVLAGAYGTFRLIKEKLTS